MHPEALVTGVLVEAPEVLEATGVPEDHSDLLVVADPEVADAQVADVQVADEDDNNSLLRHSKF